MCIYIYICRFTHVFETRRPKPTIRTSLRKGAVGLRIPGDMYIYIYIYMYMMYMYIHICIYIYIYIYT